MVCPLSLSRSFSHRCGLSSTRQSANHATLLVIACKLYNGFRLQSIINRGTNYQLGAVHDCCLILIKCWQRLFTPPRRFHAMQFAFYWWIRMKAFYCFRFIFCVRRGFFLNFWDWHENGGKADFELSPTKTRFLSASITKITIVLMCVSALVCVCVNESLHSTPDRQTDVIYLFSTLLKRKISRCWTCGIVSIENDKSTPFDTYTCAVIDVYIWKSQTYVLDNILNLCGRISAGLLVHSALEGGRPGRDHRHAISADCWCW